MQYAGIDVSADTVDVSLQDASGLREECFPNDAKGHRALVAMLSRSAPVRVALEPTSTYSLDLTATLHEAPGVEVMVVNPRKAAHFAKAHGRGKTDKGDARALRHYVASTTFVAWKPTSEEASRLRQLSRAVQDLVGQRTQEKNRLHAMKRTLGTSTVIIDVVELLIEQLTKHIQVLVDAAVALIKSSSTLLRRYELLDSIPGVGELSALHLLAELQCLPEGLGVRQLVAHAGLDPRPWESGSSVRGKRRISKRGNAHLRHALYMPALSAARTNDTIRAFAAEVEARVTCRQQAICAVMRKMLHSIVGMFRTDTAFDATRFRMVQG